MAPRKNIPITTFSWTGATNDMLGLNMYIRPRQRKNRQPAERNRWTERERDRERERDDFNQDKQLLNKIKVFPPVAVAPHLINWIHYFYMIYQINHIKTRQNSVMFTKSDSNHINLYM